MQENPSPEYTDQDGAARFLSIPPATLESWRSRGKGPPFIKAGTAVRYAFSALREWMETNTTEPDA